jgi:peptidoglycan/xylan/chitin deacetylase (PgdA/CDA1 family)
MKQLKPLLFSFLFSTATLFGCTTAPLKQSVNDAHVKNNIPALKNWNEAEHRLPSPQHRQQVSSLSQQFPGIVIYKGNSSQKLVALTFDDGPDNYYTPRILDILHAKGVPGTFFMVGKQAKHFPNMVKRIVNEGNAIGNHSWDHPKLWTLSNDQVKQEILSTENTIQQITGRRTDLFRPPYGRVTPADVALIHDLGYRVIDWSVDTLDWKGTPAPTILQFVNKEISPGGIILEHCMTGHPGELNGTLQALPQIIDRLHSQGYQFVTVQTLLAQ